MQNVRHIVPGFGSRLRELRQAAGLSMSQLADQIGVTRMQVHRLEAEANAPYFAIALRVAQALRVSISDLAPPFAKKSQKKARRVT